MRERPAAGAGTVEHADGDCTAPSRRAPDGRMGQLLPIPRYERFRITARGGDDRHALCGRRHRAVHRGQSDPRRAVPRQPRRHLAARDGHGDCAAVSIGLVVVTSKGLREVSPAAFVPIAFIVNAVMLLVEWLLLPRGAAGRRDPGLPAGLGHRSAARLRLLAHCHRTVRSPHREEALRPDCRRRHAGRPRRRLRRRARRRSCFGVAAMLPVLAAGNLYCAWEIRRLAVSYERATAARAVDVAPDLAPESPRPGLRVLRDAPYLRNLAGLVLLGTLGAALLDYLFKAQAVATFGRGEGLLRFFAIYYAATSLITFALQTSSSRFSLERLGLAATTGTPSMALLAGGIAGLVAPGLPSMVAARGAEIGVPRGAVPLGLRAVLHADAADRTARGEVAHRRRRRSLRRRDGRRRHSAGADPARAGQPVCRDPGGRDRLRLPRAGRWRAG